MAVIACLLGCAQAPRQLSNGRAWGEDILRGAPGGDDQPERTFGQRLGHALGNATLDLRTLVPAAAAGVMSIGDLDQEVSDWASDETPLFGSIQNARDYSDLGRDVLFAGALATTLLTPGGDEVDASWMLRKAGGAGVELGILEATGGITDVLKSITDRERPDGSDMDSLPSGHTTVSFAAAALTSNNLKTTRMPPPVQTGLEVASTLAAASVGWARIEGKKHYPTDVLAGAAIGNFVGILLHDLLMGVVVEDTATWRFTPAPGGAFFEWGRRF